MKITNVLDIPIGTCRTYSNVKNKFCSFYKKIGYYIVTILLNEISLSRKERVTSSKRYFILNYCCYRGPLSKFVQRIIEKQSRRNKIEDIPEMDYEVCSTTNLSMWPPANPPVPAKGFRPPKPKSDRSTSFRFRSSIEEET